MIGRQKRFLLLLLSFICFLFISTNDVLAGDCQEAIRIYNRAMSMEDLVKRERLLTSALATGCKDDKINAKIHNNLADAYENQGQPKKAIAEYKQAIMKDAFLATPYLSLGDIYTNLKKKKDAKYYYNEGFLLKNYKSKEQIVSSLDPVRSIRVVPAVTLYFGFDKAELTLAARRQLETLVEALKENDLTPYRFRLAGNTCSLGSEEYNRVLSERRAKSVEAWLKAHGITGKRLMAVGFGEDKPVSDNSTEESRRYNRRVEIRTVGVARVSSPRSAHGPELRKGLELLREGERLIAAERCKESVAYLNKALQCFEKVNFKEGIEAALMDLILAHRFLEDWEKAQHYHNLLRP